MWKIAASLLIFSCIPVNRSQFLECHDDPSFSPEEGDLEDLQFTWLGVLQYIHVAKGNPHYFRVPRVALINRQYALSTAVDAAEIPDGYALGNVVFGEYERDEVECQLSIKELAAGSDCEPAILIVPISDVLLHPEYKHFGAKNSIALLKLLKPIKSFYTVPVCLPFKDFTLRSDGRQTVDKLVHVDYSNEVPNDFAYEDKEVKHVVLLPRELCYLYDFPENSTHFAKNRMACTSGCDFRSGAPTIIHEHTGHFSLISIATGGPPCPDPLRTRRPPPPPRHILIHPYVPWITAAITGKAIGAFSKDDPFGFTVLRSSFHDQFHSWSGHWWMGGIRCWDRGEIASDLFVFYSEIFKVKPQNPVFMRYYLEIDAVRGTSVICVKIGMPYRIAKPSVIDLDSPVAKITIEAMSFQHSYKLEVQAWGYNLTNSPPVSGVESECDTGETCGEPEEPVAEVSPPRPANVTGCHFVYPEAGVKIIWKNYQDESNNVPFIVID